MKVTVDKSLIEQAIEALDEAEPYVAEVGDEIYKFHVNHPIRLKYQQSAKAREEKNRAAQEALRAALAGPAGEPVAEMCTQRGRPVLLKNAPMLADKQPLYASPPPPADVPLLSVHEILDIMRDGNNCNYNDEAEHVDFARAIEAAVRQKVGLK